MTEEKIIDGGKIQNIRLYTDWIKCTLDNGESFSVPARDLFQLFDRYNFTVKKHGQYWRTKQVLRKT